MTKNLAGLILALGICAAVFGLGSARVSSAAAGDIITLDPATTYQTINGWESVASVGAVDYPSDYQKWSGTAIDLAVNDLGINRVRLEVRSGAENSVDSFTAYLNGSLSRTAWKASWYTIQNDDSNPNNVNLSGFKFSELDHIIDTAVLPMKQLVEANGEQLYINLNYIDFSTASVLHYQNPDEYAEFMLATFQHIQSKYGFVPDAIEIILEPDNSSWSGSHIGPSIVATADLLQASGFAVPDFLAPSVTNAGEVPAYLDGMLASAPTSMDYLTEVSYHRYGGISDSVLQTIAARAELYGIRASMLEHIGSGHVALHDDLKKANVQAWQQFTLAYPTSDNGAQYFTVANPTGASPTVSYGGITKYLRQYFKYIRSGAVRFDATSNNIGSFDPVAFRNTDGGDVVVVKASTGGSFSIVGLQAGTYGVQYTTSAEFATDLADVTVSSGGTLDTSIPAAGVLTVFPKPTMLTVVVTGSPTVGNITTIDIVADVLPDGLAGFELKVALGSTSTAEIVNAFYNTGLSLTLPPGITPAAANLFAADGNLAIGAGDTNVVLATLEVRGITKGTSSVDITIGSSFGVQNENGSVIRLIATTPGTLVVPNANPVVTAAADLAVYDLSPLNLTVGSFTDGDLGDTHTATIDWGDGSLVDSGTPAVGPISGMHSYATSSAYSVIVSVTDSDGGSGTATFNIVVQNFQFLPGGVGPARDINGDGKAEDVNGSGVIDFNDVVLLFQNLLGPPVQDNQGDFDFNGNGRIDFDDVVQLFLSFAP